MGFIITVTLLGLLVAVVLFAGLMSWQENRRKYLESPEVKRAREAIDQIRLLAYEYKALDTTDLPYRLLDVIENYEGKKAK